LLNQCAAAGEKTEAGQAACGRTSEKIAAFREKVAALLVRKMRETAAKYPEGFSDEDAGNGEKMRVAFLLIQARYVVRIIDVLSNEFEKSRDSAVSVLLCEALETASRYLSPEYYGHTTDQVAFRYRELAPILEAALRAAGRHGDFQSMHHYTMARREVNAAVRQAAWELKAGTRAAGKGPADR
jgi:hypothetical protein